MKNHKLTSLSDYEKREAEKNHNLVYSFLHRHGYSIEDYYNVVIFGYLKAIQIYNRREDLRNKFDLAFICEQYMRSAVGDHFKAINAKKRNPAETILSLDADFSDLENSYAYNLQNFVGGKKFEPESEIIEAELLAELLENLSEVQRKITEMKMNGYNNKEIYLILEIKPSTYYKELQRIKSALEKLVG